MPPGQARLAGWPGLLRVPGRRRAACRRLARIAVAAAAAAAPPAAAAQTARIDLLPRSAEIELRAYALGLFPVDGTFGRFAGAVTYDPRVAMRCEIELTIDTASLAMSDQTIRDDAVSPAFLDAAAFPQLSFRGRCAGDGVRGDLTLHGVTRPIALSLERDGTRLLATGLIHRSDWELTGRPVLAGPNIRLRVSLVLPTDATRVLASPAASAPAR